jgi:hypothetical protein
LVHYAKVQKHLLALLLLSGSGLAQSTQNEPVAQEPVAIVELGGANSWNVDGGSSTGGDVAVEFTPIENWLEIEVGTTPLFARHSVEWGTDALLKKPWTLSRKAELMVGFGPEWVHTRGLGITRNSLAGEFAVDFMYWPGAKHRLGWFIEPVYEYTFGYGHERSIGVSSGLLIAIP